jgi:hypothetical protein
MALLLTRAVAYPSSLGTSCMSNSRWPIAQAQSRLVASMTPMPSAAPPSKSFMGPCREARPIAPNHMQSDIGREAAYGRDPCHSAWRWHQCQRPEDHFQTRIERLDCVPSRGAKRWCDLAWILGVARGKRPPGTPILRLLRWQQHLEAELGQVGDQNPPPAASYGSHF